MKITNLTYENPDSDGEVSLEANVLIENNSDFDIEYVKVSTTILNGSGVTVGGSIDDDDSVFINPKSSGDLDLYLNYINKTLIEDLDKMTVLVQATAYKREFMKIGALEVPEVGKSAMLKKNLTIGGVAELRGISVLRKKNEDGEIDLDINGGFRNISDTHIERAQLTTKLVDQRDAEIDTDVDYNTVPAQSSYLFNPNFYGIKSAKVKNAEFRFTASIFVPVGTYTAEGTPILNQD